GEKKRRVGELAGNIMLWKITEDLIFTDPYCIAELNRWTTPQLDADAKAVRDDVALKIAVSELKEQFLCDTEAMIHGDLHTGSIMVTEDSTKVIDPEFVMYGPMGFDTGAVIGNLLLSYFSQDGHAASPGARHDYQDWILAQAEAVWTEVPARRRGHRHLASALFQRGRPCREPGPPPRLPGLDSGAGRGRLDRVRRPL